LIVELLVEDLDAHEAVKVEPGRQLLAEQREARVPLPAGRKEVAAEKSYRFRAPADNHEERGGQSRYTHRRCRRSAADAISRAHHRFRYLETATSAL
jgi:hypothetical protein